MSTSPFYSMNAIHAGNGIRSYALWPQYFATYGRAEPPRVTHTPFSFAWGHPELAPWEVKALYPEYAALFAQSMEAKAMVGGGMRWAGEGAFYDLGWLAGEEGVVVDVGGGLGQLLKDVLADVPGVGAGRCVLQDRREVIDQAVEKADPALAGAVMMEHDFHVEQPIKGELFLPVGAEMDHADDVGFVRGFRVPRPPHPAGLSRCHGHGDPAPACRRHVGRQPQGEGPHRRGATVGAAGGHEQDR